MLMPNVDDVLADLERLTYGDRPVGDVPHPKKRDPRDVEDSKYRKAYGQDGRRPFGKPLRAAFYEYLPDVPRTKYVGIDFARTYLAKIYEVQEMQCWSRKERERLRQLQRRWERRVRGEDARYNRLGTAPGREYQNRIPSPTDRLNAIKSELEQEAAKWMPPTPFGVWKQKGL